MVAKGKASTRHIPRQDGLPRYVDHPDFAEPEARRTLLPGIAALMNSESPPNQVTEVRLFMAMHYCAYRAHGARGRRVALTAAAKRWVHRRHTIRDHLVMVNLGLAYEMLRRSRFTNVDEDELLSEGLRALFDAVEAFDPWRGYRFSTYACNAIYRGFLRLSKLETRRASCITLGYDTRMERGVGEMTATDWDDRFYAERLQHILDDNRAELTQQERYILEQRFPFVPNCKRATLQRLGGSLSLSKERVRQLQVTALGKLRSTLVAEPLLT